MRNIFVDEVRKLMREDNKIVFLTAECGFNVVEAIQAEFPDRFYNTGIAEQSLVGIAAGLTLRGYKPVAYTMSMFLSMRAYEQIRVDVAYQNVPVLLAGVIPGLGYGNAGPTHHAIEDIAIMRVLPNMTVVCAGCETDVRAATRQAIECGKPCYIGLPRNTLQFSSPYSDKVFQLGNGIQMGTGTDIAIITYGGMLPNAMHVAKALKTEGVNARVINMHTIKPLDVNMVEKTLNECHFCITLEEENIIGGLGGAVSEYISEHQHDGCRFKRLGIPDTFGDVFGSQAFLWEHYQLDIVGIQQQIRELMNGAK